jgi:hypothetical protein
MHYPSEYGILEHLRMNGPDATQTLLTERQRQAWHEENGDAAHTGQHAGVVLMILYGLACGGWKLPPGRVASLRLAYHCAAAHARQSNALPTPMPDPIPAHESTGKMATCFRGMRAVSHLWAAVMLHKLNIMGYAVAGRDLLIADGFGRRRLLATARMVQRFALAYRDPTTRKGDLLGGNPWLVPPGVEPPTPAWGELPAWLAAAVRGYRAAAAKGKRAKRRPARGA